MVMPGPKLGSKAPSTESTAASSSGALPKLSDGERERPASDVILHMYQCDSWTGWLNNVWLKKSEMPIYHLGVEVHGEEWSFLYFEDCWDDESVSGVIRCPPKRMVDYEYQESISLGPTPLGQDEVDQLLLRLHYEYPACSYHLTRRNCMTFAEDLVRQLRPPRPFPAELKGIVDAASQAPNIDATVDYGWSWAKWYMLRKHSQPTSGDQPGAYLCCAHSGADRQSSMWTLLLQPGYSCSGKMCPAAPKGRVEGGDDDYSSRLGSAPPREGGGVQLN